MRERYANFWLLASLVTVSSQGIAAEPAIQLEDMDVLAPDQPTLQSTPINQLSDQASGDLGDQLRQLTGVSSVRRGGKGFDPVIRGQQQNQLNVLIDGGYLFGACPGRMDPPTSYAALNGYDQITVVRGNQSVLYGSGGSGGTVLVERNRPYFSEPGIKGSVEGKATSNSDRENIGADMTAGNQQGFVRLYGDHDHQGDYKDGNGEKVSSAYHSKSGGVVLGYQLTDKTYVELNYEAVRERDIHYAGNGMDAPDAESNSWRFKLEQDLDLGPFYSMELKAYRSDIDHLMDNFSVRDRPSRKMNMLAESSSDTWGGSWMAFATMGDVDLTIGADLLQNNKDAARYKGNKSTTVATTPVDLMWPGVEQKQYGLFSQADIRLDGRNSLRAGVRVDRVDADATKAHEKFGNQPAAKYYLDTYGTDKTRAQETNIGAVLGLTHKLTDDQELTAYLSRSVVTADATQRFMARGDWVGNPDLDPEVHQQLELGWSRKRGEHQLDLTLFYDQVDDYILQHIDSGVTKYKNIDARLYGFEAQYQYPLSSELRFSSSVALTEGRNRTDGGDLPQIAPLSATLGLDWQRNRWSTGVMWELATRQDNIDEDSGLDAGPTAGYGVFNLYGQYEVTKQLELRAGVDNLFDKNYALHLNKRASDPFNPQAVRVNEPGREFWLSARWHF